MRTYTYNEVVEMFIEDMMPLVQSWYESDSQPDWPARREAWNNYTDYLCKEEAISDEDYEEWPQPPICGD